MMMNKEDQKRVIFYLEEFWRIAIFFLMVDTFIQKMKREIRKYSYYNSKLAEINIEDPQGFIKNPSLLRALAYKDIIVGNYNMETGKLFYMILYQPKNCLIPL